jgi:IS5 family transposase
MERELVKEGKSKKGEEQMGLNKIYNEDLFTSKANEKFSKHIKTQSKRTLELLEEKIDWKKLLAPIEKKISKKREKLNEAGRKSFSLEVIVKCFMLQSMYDLSDPRLEEEIADRRSFQIFLGLNSGDSIPDETTICRYRKMFSEEGLDKVLFESMNKQFRQKGLILDKGTIVDATLKEAQASYKSRRDKDADYTKKNNKSHYGYKGHIAVEEESNIIKKVEFTKASIHDSEMFDNLVDYNEESVLADKGYASKQRRQKLEEKGIFDGILDRPYRNRELTKGQKTLNRILSRVRRRIERAFGYMKWVLGYGRCSYYDIKRNRFEFTFAAIGYNIRRMITLTS